MRTFKGWLLSQKHRRDPIGDLANDLITDQKVHKIKIGTNKKDVLRRALNVADVVEAAFEEYKTYAS